MKRRRDVHADGEPVDQGNRPTRVAPGVFFPAPVSLPRGRHDLSREAVTSAQRIRAMIAATELLASAGHAGFGVREICSLAGMSRSAFYECFADKDECIFAAYDQFIAVVTQRLVAVTPVNQLSWADFVGFFVRAYLGVLEQDLVVARAFQVEMDSLGRAARARRRDALTALAGYLREAHLQHAAETGATTAPLSAFVGAVYAIRQISSDRLDEHDDPDLMAVAPELTTWAVRMLTESTG